MELSLFDNVGQSHLIGANDCGLALLKLKLKLPVAVFVLIFLVGKIFFC